MRGGKREEGGGGERGKKEGEFILPFVLFGLSRSG